MKHLKIFEDVIDSIDFDNDESKIKQIVNEWLKKDLGINSIYCVKYQNNSKLTVYLDSDISARNEKTFMEMLDFIRKFEGWTLTSSLGFSITADTNELLNELEIIANSKKYNL